MKIDEHKYLKVGDKFTNIEPIERDGTITEWGIRGMSNIPIGTIFEIYDITGNTTIHYRYTFNDETRSSAFMLKSINAGKCIMLREYNLDKLGI